MFNHINGNVVSGLCLWVLARCLLTDGSQEKDVCNEGEKNESDKCKNE